MPVSKVAVGSGIVGGGVPVGAGVYYSTRVTVKNVIYSDALPWEGVSEEWEKLQEELKSDSGELESDMRKIKEIVDKSPEDVIYKPPSGDSNEVIDTNGGQVEDPRIKSKGDLVKYWCMDNYNKVIWSLVESSEEALSSTAKKYCIYSIDKRITAKSLSKLTTEEKLKPKLNALKGNSHGLKLDYVLKSLARNPEVENKWNDLKNWCDSQYIRGFKGENSETWIRVNYFCLENNS